MRLKRKIPTFVFGVSVGLIVGIGFFVFKINDLFIKLKESAKEQITVIQQPVKNVPVEGDNTTKNRERFKIDFGKSKRVNYAEVDSLIKQDSEINVATDELLSVKSVKAIVIQDDVQNSDSLAAKLANVEVVKSNLYFIEFWKTPLNSKGYRFNRNKIMLYGFINFDDVQLYELDDSFYIKSSEQVYKLFPGGEFMQLERVLDSSLLAKIN
jgi:hypothetical protein